MNTQTMTLNQISGLTGKTERSIRLWINKPSEKTSEMSEKMSEIRSKISEARKTQRSIYIPIADLEEIESIIQSKKGMNVNKVVNEGLQLWLKQNKKKAVNK